MRIQNYLNKKIMNQKTITVGLILATIIVLWLITTIFIESLHSNMFRDTYEYKGNKEWQTQKEECLGRGGIPIKSNWDGQLKECRL